MSCKPTKSKINPIITYMIPIVTFVALTACGPAEFSGKADSASVSEETTPISALEENPALAVKYACSNDKKIAICHVPEGNPDNRHTLCLPQPAIDAHLAQHDASAAVGDEDYLGECK